MDVDRLTALEDVAAIRRLKATYARTADLQDWDAFRALFTDDCTFDTGTTAVDAVDGGVGPNMPPVGGFRVQGTDEFVERLAPRLRGVRTVHHLHEPEIELTGAESARGIWPIYDLVIRPAGDSPSWWGHGYYHEEYCKQDGRWLIASMTVLRLRMDDFPGAP
jgi:hypothetical protein